MSNQEKSDQSREKSLYFLLLSTLRRNNLHQGKPEKTKQLVKNLEILELDDDWVILSVVDTLEETVTISKTEFKFYPNKKLSSYSDDPTLLNKETANYIVRSLYELFEILKDSSVPDLQKKLFKFPFQITIVLISSFILPFRNELPNNLTVLVQVMYSLLLANYIGTLAVRKKHQRLFLALLFPIIIVWVSFTKGNSFKMDIIFAFLFLTYSLGILGHNKLVAANMEITVALVIFIAVLCLNMTNVYDTTIFDNLFLLMYMSWMTFSKLQSQKKHRIEAIFYFFVLTTILLLTLLVIENWINLFSIVIAFVLSYKAFQNSKRKSELELFLGVWALFL